MAARQPDDRATDVPVGVFDTRSAAQLDLEFGLCDDFNELKVKSEKLKVAESATSEELLFLNSSLFAFHFSGSDNICKPALEINAWTVFSAWFQAPLLTAIAEGPVDIFSWVRQGDTISEIIDKGGYF